MDEQEFIAKRLANMVRQMSARASATYVAECPEPGPGTWDARAGVALAGQLIAYAEVVGDAALAREAKRIQIACARLALSRAGN